MLGETRTEECVLFRSPRRTHRATTTKTRIQSVRHGKLLSLIWWKSSSDGYDVAIWSLLSCTTQHDLMRTENRTHSSKGFEEAAIHNECESDLENIVWTAGSLHSPLEVLTTKINMNMKTYSFPPSQFFLLVNVFFLVIFHL